MGPQRLRAGGMGHLPGGGRCFVAVLRGFLGWGAADSPIPLADLTALSSYPSQLPPQLPVPSSPPVCALVLDRLWALS